MQPNKTKLALIIGVMYLGVSGTSFAASESFTITATTIADVALEETTVLDFGTNIFTTTGSCTMAVGEPGEAEMQVYTTDGTTTADANYGLLNGTSCVPGATAIPGVYTISGSSGADVTITLNDLTETDYSFAPAGVVGSYNGIIGSTTPDDIIPLVSGTAYPMADTTDAGVPVVTDGELVFILGGVLTVTNTLTANTLYDAGTFTVNVVY